MSDTHATFHKMGGWSVVYNPFTGSLYIYRPDRDGDIVLGYDDAGYNCEIYAHADKLIASCSALKADLVCDEPRPSSLSTG